MSAPEAPVSVAGPVGGGRRSGLPGVNRGLTAGRVRRVVENEGYAAFCRRMVTVRPNGWYGHESTAAYRRSWLSGFATAVHLRLTQAEARAATEQPVTAAGTSTGLVLRDRTDRVAQVVRDAHPGLRTMGHRRLSGSGRSEGYGAGARANLGHAAVGATRALPRGPAAPR